MEYHPSSSSLYLANLPSSLCHHHLRMISPVSPPRPTPSKFPPDLISSFILSSVFLPFNYLQHHVSYGNAYLELLSLVAALTLTSKLLGRVTLTIAIYSLLLLAYQMTEIWLPPLPPFKPPMAGSPMSSSLPNPMATSVWHLVLFSTPSWNHFLGFLDTKLSLFTSFPSEDFFSCLYHQIPFHSYLHKHRNYK